MREDRWGPGAAPERFFQHPESLLHLCKHRWAFLAVFLDRYVSQLAQDLLCLYVYTPFRPSHSSRPSVRSVLSVLPVLPVEPDELKRMICKDVINYDQSSGMCDLFLEHCDLFHELWDLFYEHCDLFLCHGDQLFGMCDLF